jgi:AcrR family transcriptional regulator
MGRRATLTRDDWVEAATDWVAEHGVAALAVEPLARALGVTKGAFYWCFANRDELLLAVLERWEAQGTQAIIALVEQVPDTAQQARELIRIVTRTVEGSGPNLARPVRLQYALWSAAADPLVKPAVERATAARVAFLAETLRRAGLDAATARDRATLGYASYVGMVMLRATHSNDEAVGAHRAGLVDAYVTMLLAPPPPLSPPPPVAKAAAKAAARSAGRLAGSPAPERAQGPAQEPARGLARELARELTEAPAGKAPAKPPKKPRTKPPATPATPAAKTPPAARRATAGRSRRA